MFVIAFRLEKTCRFLSRSNDGNYFQINLIKNIRLEPVNENQNRLIESTTTTTTTGGLYSSIHIDQSKKFFYF